MVWLRRDSSRIWLVLALVALAFSPGAGMVEASLPHLARADARALTRTSDSAPITAAATFEEVTGLSSGSPPSPESASRPTAIDSIPWEANERIYDSAHVGWWHADPQIAVDPSGTAYVVWQDCRDPGTSCDIYFAYRTSGGTWSANERVNHDLGTTDQAAPAIAVDGAGNVFAVWQDSRDGDANIYFSYRDASSQTWSVDARVNDDAGASEQASPAISVTSAGDALIVWEDSRNASADIYSSTWSVAAGAFGANARVDSDTSGAAQEDPDVALLPDGTAYAVWTDGRASASNSDIYVTSRPFGGSWTTDDRVNAQAAVDTSTSLTRPSIAATLDVSTTEHVYVAWASETVGFFNIYTADRAPDGSWTNEVSPNEELQSAIGWSDAQSVVSIRSDSTGNTYVLWADWLTSGDPSKPNLKIAFRASGGTDWGTAEIVTDAPTMTWGSPSLAIGSDELPHAVWMDDRTDPFHDIYYSSYDAISGWSANSQVNDDPGLIEQNVPSIGMDPAGNAFVVWADDRNAAYPYQDDQDIYFAYRPAGGPWGANVRVNDDGDQLSIQTSPAIAVDPDGNTFAIWLDYRDDWQGDVYFSYRDHTTGIWSTNAKINDDPEDAQQVSPAIAVDGAGNAYAVWQDNRLGNPDIYFAYREAVTGVWSANVRVNHDSGSNAQYSPAISVDASGKAVAAWQDCRSEPVGDVYFSLRAPGGSWGSDELVNDDGVGFSQTGPSVAIDSTGVAYAVWQDGRSLNPDIYASVRSALGVWSANVRVDDDSGTSGQFGPAVIAGTSGHIYAAWHDNRNPASGGADIYGAFLRSNGSWESNVRINDDSSSADQLSVRLAVDGTDNVIAVWEDGRGGTEHVYSALGTSPAVWTALARPAQITDLTISGQGADLLLEWTHDGLMLDEFEVWRSSTEPFLEPEADGVVKIGIPGPADREYLDEGAWNALPSSYFYLVRGVNSSFPGEDSNRVGRFSIALTPGD